MAVTLLPENFASSPALFKPPAALLPCARRANRASQLGGRNCSPIDHVFRARDSRSAWRDKKGNHVRDLTWLCRTPERNADKCVHKLVPRRIFTPARFTRTARNE